MFFLLILYILAVELPISLRVVAFTHPGWTADTGIHTVWRSAMGVVMFTHLGWTIDTGIHMTSGPTQKFTGVVAFTHLGWTAGTGIRTVWGSVTRVVTFTHLG
ncbi:hypothetical protein BDZ94DRAFT_1311933 [Collybia nuda]|uniref:Secreted protein n=1 Tax=Collybia nuda TaxID=64659 RepID=A0A9P5Y275_9AGAR|nr:hypothetical protein BDZ94DRAFT_1311933 [Collybia nuda]